MGTVGNSGRYPLTSAQHYVWIDLELTDKQAIYILGGYLRIDGAVDHAALKAATEQAVDDFASFRLDLAERDGTPFQTLREHVAFSFPERDFTGSADGDADCRRWIDTQVERPFDRTTPPLFEFALLRANATRSYWYMKYSHLVFDGWSIRPFVTRVAELYAARLEGRAVAPAPRSFLDFVAYEQAYLGSPRHRRDAAYWAAAYPDRPDPLFAIGTSDEAGSRRRSARLARADFAAVATLAAQWDVSLHDLLLAVLGLCLGLAHGRRDLMVGVTMHNRPRAQFRQTTGMFTSVVPARIVLPPESRFVELVRALKATLRQLYQHQHYPSADIFRAVNGSADTSAPYDVTFSYEAFGVPIRLGGHPTELVVLTKGFNRHALHVAVQNHQDDGDVFVHFDHEAALGSSIDALCDGYVDLIAQIRRDGQRPLRDYRLLPRTAEARIAGFATGEVVPDFAAADFLALFAERVAGDPGAVAVEGCGITLTYRALDARADAIARHLAAAGVGIGAVVGVALDRGPDLVAAFLGVLKAGCAYLPLDRAVPPARLARMCAVARPAAILAQAARPRPPIDCDAIVLDCDRLGPPPETSAPPGPIGPHALAYVIFTSGTTGTPAGVMVSHRGLANLALGQSRRFGLSANSTVYPFASIGFDASISEFVMALAAGGTLDFGPTHERLLGDELHLYLASAGISHITLPPSLLRVTPRDALPAGLTLIVAGEACPLDVVAGRAGLRIFNAYGPTEATVCATAFAFDPAEPRFPIGQPMPNMTVHILDAQLRPVPVGLVGEIHIGGIALAWGYADDPALTADRFLPDPFASVPGARLYRTGDRAAWLPDGMIDYRGRTDAQVKVRGHRIELAEVEAAVTRHADVQAAVVRPYVRPDGGTGLAAFVVPRPSRRGAARQVEQWRTLYDDLFDSRAQPASDFDLTGWTSSYTDAPIPPAQMREWIEETVADILAFAPRAVLEIGCGAGLLLARIAPRCDRFVGTDLSAAVLQRTRALVAGDPRLCGVTVLHRPADDFTDIAPGSFDAVVLNSVCQYFPSLEYLRTVIAGAVAALRDGGTLYIGDVRSAPLHAAFCASVEAARATDDTIAAEIARRADERARGTRELLVDPVWFEALVNSEPRVRRVSVRLKQGRAENELTKFRFQVIATVGAAPAPPPRAITWIDAGALGAGAIAQALIATPDRALGLHGLPNAALAAEARLAPWLEDEPGAAIARWRAAAPPAGGMTPAALADLARACGRELELRYSRTAGPFAIDAVLFSGTSDPRWLDTSSEAPSAPAARGATPLLPTAQAELLPALHAHLQATLPASMVPGAYAVIDALPMTLNGKLDDAALPRPVPITRRSVASAAPAASEAEAALLEIWRDVLATEVGPHDGFAELGGDSIQSIQIASRARARGYGVTVRQIFELQTVARLAAVAQAEAAPLAQEDDAAAFPLTPIQRWFFARDLPEPDRFNQFITVPLPDGVDAARLEAAFARIAARHDSLRLRFACVNGAWQQRAAPADAPLPFYIRDLSASGPGEAERAIAEEGAARHAALDLSSGPIWSATLYRTRDGEPDRLLWLAHHLAVDGVSWRILLDELDTLYRQGAAAALPDSFPFARWARGVHRYAAEGRDPLRLDRYLAQIDGLAVPAPPARAATCETPLTTVFEPALSQKLLRASVARCGGQARDVLAGALALALLDDESAGATALLIEGHGRAESAVDADLTATTGWFTTLFPVVLPVARDAAPTDQIARVRAAIEAATEASFDYAVARYMGDDSPLARRARAICEPDVTFGYLGSVARPRHSALLDRLDEARFGLVTGASRPALCGLDVQALHVGDRLHVTWTFARGRYTHAHIARLAAAFERHLAQLLAGQPLSAAGDQVVVCPASPAQQGILLHALLDRESGLYVEQLLFDLAGPLDIGRLRHALTVLVDRHEALRTQFRSDADRTIVQEIRPAVAVPLQPLDWRHMAATEQERRFETLLQDDRVRGLDLAVAPLFRLTLVTLAEDRARLVWSHSHALVDGWSMAILLGELLALYRGEGPATRTAPQFRAYVAWLERARDDAAARAAWRALLAGFESATPLRLAPPRGPAPGAGEANLMLDAGLTARITALAKTQRITPSTVFHAAWALLLARAGGTRDVVFGTIDSGRSAPIDGIEAIVGLLIRTVPLRVAIDETATVGGFLRDLHLRQLERDAIAPLGLAEIQAQSDIPVGEPLFESLIVVENYPLDPAMLGAQALDISVRHVALRTNYPLTLAVIPGDRTELRLSYARDRFAPEAAASALRWLEGLLDQMVAEPGQALHRIHLADREAPPIPPAIAPLPLPSSLVPQFEEQVARRPDAPAVTDRDGTLSYAELDTRANRLAHGLRARGVGPEVAVGIHLPRSAAMIVALLAVLKAGGAYVPLDRRYPADRLRAIVANARLTGVIARRGDTAALPNDLPVFDPDETATRDGTKPSTGHHPEQLAYILHTSGSTGAPKGVAIPMAGPVALVDWARGRYSAVELARVLFSTSLNFDLSVFEIFVPLCLGGSVVVAEDILDVPRLRDVTLVNTVPSAIAEVLRGASLPASIVTVNVAGEPVPQALVDAIHQSPAVRAVYNLYGPTETTTYSTCAALHADSPLAPSIGAALDREAAYILDRNLHPMPPGATGDLFIGGRGLARGYAGDARATASAFLPDPFSSTPGARMYRTGDLARLRADGEIAFLGRADDQVKVRGFRIELAEIEAALKARDDVAEAVVTVTRDETLGALLVAHVVPAPGAVAPGAERWRQALATRLPVHMIPQHFQVLDRLPRTPSGKIARRQLGEAYAPAPDQDSPAPAFAGPIEERLAAIFRDLLKVSSVAPTDSFFDLGGHSLLMLRLSYAIRSRFGCELPLRRLFEQPSVRGIATLIDAEAPAPTIAIAPPGTGPIVLRREGDGPSLYLLCPASGSAMGYLGLADAVRSFGTIWGLQAPGLARGERRITSVAAMARHFCDQVIERHASRPAGERIFLGGWSFGGLVALELARQLNALGHVPVIFVFDSETSRSAHGRSGWARARAELRGLSFSDGWSYQTLRQIALWAGLSLPPRAAALFHRRLPEMLGYFAEIAANSWRSARIFWVNWRAARRFRLPTLYADVHLLRTKCDTPEALHDDPVYTLLRSHVRGHVTGEPVPGTHLTLFDRKHIRRLAEILESVVDAHLPDARSSEVAFPIQEPVAEEIVREHAL